MAAESFTYIPGTTVEAFISQNSEIASEVAVNLSRARVGLYFLNEDGDFEANARSLSDQTLKFEPSAWNEGLMGLSVLENRAQAWPDDEMAKKAYRASNPETCYEISVPIRSLEVPAGVLLANFKDGDEPTISEKRRYIAELETWAERISLLIERESFHRPAIERIRQIVSTLIRKTNSKAGYVAFKTPNGQISYITNKNDGQDIFLRLNISEGLTGKVFRTGLDIISGNVWKEEEYKASDQEINSEILLAGKNEASVLCVLNLEATGKHHYGVDYEELCRKSLSEIVSLVQELLSSGLPKRSNVNDVTSIVEECNLFFRDVEVSSLRAMPDLALEFIQECLRTRLDGQQLFLLRSDQSLESEAVAASVLLRNNVEAGAEHIDGTWYTFAPFRIKGDLVAIVGYSSAERGGYLDFRLINTVCRVAELEVSNAEEKMRSKAFEELAMACGSDPNSEVSLFKALSFLKVICDVDEITVFSKFVLNEEERIFPIASTSQKLEPSVDLESSYLIQEDDGLTGFAATRRVVTSINNVENDVELKNISKSLSWKKKVSEDRGLKIRSFIASPIEYEASRTLVGLIRGHRLQSRSGGSPFSVEEARRFEVVAKLLGTTHGDILSSYFD